MSTTTAAAGLLKSLGHPTRLQIVLLLDGGDRCVHELVGELGLSQPLVSQHLRVLKEVGLLASRRRGREVVYGLADSHVAAIATAAVTHAAERPSA